MSAETRKLIEAIDRRRGHAFFPPDDEWTALPRLYSTEDVLTRDKLVVLHYFVGSADWWIVEVEHDTHLAFGFACLGDPDMAEWGYVDLNELAVIFKAGSMATYETGDPPKETVVVQPPLVVERDLYWQVRPAGEVEGIKIPGGGS